MSYNTYCHHHRYNDNAFECKINDRCASVKMLERMSILCFVFEVIQVV